MILSKMKSDIYIVYTLIFIATLSVVIVTVQRQTNDIVTELTLNRAQMAKQEFNSYLAGMEQRAMQRAEWIASRKNLIDGIKSNDYDVIKKELLDFSADIDLLSVCDANGVMLCRSYNENFGDNASSQQNIAEVLRTGTKASYISLLLRGLTICSSAPVYDGDVLIGIVNCNFDLTKTEYLDDFKAKTGCEVAIVSGTERIATTIRDQSGNRITGTHANEFALDMILVQNKEYYMDIIDIYGGMYAVHYSPLITGERTIGMLFTGVNVDLILTKQRSMNNWILLASLLGIVAATAFVFVSNRLTRKRETELRRSHELNELQLARLNIVIQVSNLGLWEVTIVDNDPVNPGNTFMWSNEFRQMLGYSNEIDFPNTFDSWYDRLHPDDKDQAIVAITNHLSDRTGKTPYDMEYRLLNKNGEYSYYHVVGETIRDENGNALRVIGALKDITESKNILIETERHRNAAEAANQAKSSFLANMSHEIRTPMNAVLGMSELLLQENLNNRQRGYVEDMKTSAMSLLNIINEILDFSKMQSGKFDLVPVHYDFDMLIDNIGSITQFLVDNKSIAFKLDIQEHPHLYLYGDDVRLRQVLLNLLGNAVKFTNEGYVQLTVCFTDTTVKMTVSDTGSGIPAESIAKIFNAFEQADMLQNRSTKGTGLGLTIAKSIVDMMNGQITVESVYGQGTSFHVEIPKVLGDESFVHRVSDTETVISAPGVNILVVDDNKINLGVASGLLQIFKIAADTASSGMQAIELIQKKNYDLVFMDQRMPEMTGIETTKAIRELGITVPIISLTASVASEAKAQMLASGMNDHLSKPIVKTELVRVLTNWIPSEKMIINKRPQVASPIEAGNEEDKEFWEIIKQTDELDLSIGLDRVDGQRDVYKKALKLMMREIEKSDTHLKTFLSDDDMGNFGIEVHGIKGTLANIGAMELSARAFDLETASDNRDAAFCVSNLPDFLKKLNKLYMSLNEAFSIQSYNDSPIEIPPELPLIFEELMSAFDETDLVLIDQEIDNINALNLNGKIKDEVEVIKDAVMMMDYAGAAEHINQLLHDMRHPLSL